MFLMTIIILYLMGTNEYYVVKALRPINFSTTAELPGTQQVS